MAVYARNCSLGCVARVSGKSAEAEILKPVGKAIREHRQRFGWSQEKLAYEAELDRSHMGRIERGERNVTLLNLYRIARALGVRPSDLLVQAAL